MADPEALERLAEAAREGDRRATARLLGELRPIVCRWALVWTGSPDLAEDVAQRVLVRVHRSLRGWEPEGRITTWVYRITRNVMIDLSRAEEREDALRDRLHLEWLADAAARRNARPPIAGDTVRLLHKLMETLSPQQRAALDLVDLQGFTAAEAGEMLGIAPATVRVHAHRARAALRERWGDEAET